ncbi:MAG: hypothetical protein E7647_07160 [Ruminococcaceae bacterium]|nr:hypothetical protein [Oscillospiraceae bacterium]
MTNHTDERLTALKSGFAEVDRLEKKKTALRKTLKDVFVSKATYDTDHAKRENERHNEHMKRLEKEAQKKAAANKNSNLAVITVGVVVAVALHFLLPGDAFKFYGAIAAAVLSIIIVIIKSAVTNAATSRSLDDARAEHSRERKRAEEEDEKEQKRYQSAVQRAKKKKKEEIDIEIEKLDRKIDEANRAIAELGILSPEEILENPSIIDVLEYSVESRGLTLDEALESYREDQRRRAEKQRAEKNARKEAERRREYITSERYRGKDWELLDLKLTPDVIADLELDAEALMDSYKRVRPSEEKERMLNTWFCMTALQIFLADMKSDEAKKAAYNGMMARLKESGSWKLAVLAVALNVASVSALTGMFGISNPLYLDEAVKNSDDVREARSDEEKAYMSTMMTGCMIASGAMGRFAKDIVSTVTGGSSSSYSALAPSYTPMQDTSDSVRRGSLESTHERYRSTPAKKEKTYDSSGYTSFNADKKAYIVSSPGDADLKVYFTSAWEADIKYYIVKSSWEADVKIYPVSSAWDADIKAFRID